MRSTNFFGLITLLLSTLFINSQTFTFQQSIISSTDDAEEKYDGSYITTSSSDLEMMYDSWNSQGLQTVGLRFSNITIPINATIVNAYIQFTADGSSSGNIGYHHIHHLNPSIPFYRLPETMRAVKSLQNPKTTSLRIKDIISCLKLRVWNEELNKMSSLNE